MRRMSTQTITEITYVGSLDSRKVGLPFIDLPARQSLCAPEFRNHKPRRRLTEDGIIISCLAIDEGLKKIHCANRGQNGAVP